MDKQNRLFHLQVTPRQIDHFYQPILRTWIRMAYCGSREIVGEFQVIV